MDSLTKEPFNLVQGDLIVVKAQAINSVGPGEFSDPNTFGVTIQ